LSGRAFEPEKRIHFPESASAKPETGEIHMGNSPIRGVVAAVVTPIGDDLEPDLDRFVAFCRHLLDNGCDGLNICGTTGEAPSFTVAQRTRIMEAAARSLPLDRLMVGTGAAAVGDAVALTSRAAALGFPVALVLPPFYYKGVDETGIVRYIAQLAAATAAEGTDIFLYNFPQMTGIVYTPALVSRLSSELGDRIAGLKDSSGDLSYAAEIAALPAGLSVFPSNEGVLLDARAGKFAGCISASANVNAPFCARAFHEGDETALATAVRARGLVSRQALIPSIKAVVAHQRSDPAFGALVPPLTPLGQSDRERLLADIDALTQG
jgi:4-hydroxy-tetrahydrodipicolinate synthase